MKKRFALANRFEFLSAVVMRTLPTHHRGHV